MINKAAPNPNIDLTRWPGSAGEYAINLHPDITSLGSAYLDVLEAYNWQTITILYQDNNSMMTLKKILQKTGKVGDRQSRVVFLPQLFFLMIQFLMFQI